MTFTQFQNSRIWTDDPELTHPQLGRIDGDSDPGYAYGETGHLFIELYSIGKGTDRRFWTYTVELFGDSFTGSLLDCEAELWRAAEAEGALISAAEYGRRMDAEIDIAKQGSD